MIQTGAEHRRAQSKADRPITALNVKENDIMKMIWKTVLTAKVHNLLFPLACLLLAAVGLSARTLVDDTSSVMDRDLQQSQQPSPNGIKFYLHQRVEGPIAFKADH